MSFAYRTQALFRRWWGEAAAAPQVLKHNKEACSIKGASRRTGYMHSKTRKLNKNENAKNRKKKERKEVKGGGEKRRKERRRRRRGGYSFLFACFISIIFIWLNIRSCTPRIIAFSPAFSISLPPSTPHSTPAAGLLLLFLNYRFLLYRRNPQQRDQGTAHLKASI